jgi:hypothetical protein
MGTSKLIDSSAAFLFEVPGLNSPLVVQELQIAALDGSFVSITREHPESPLRLTAGLRISGT